MGAPAQFHSSDIWTEMKVEFHGVITLFEELEEAGKFATLYLSKELYKNIVCELVVFFQRA